MAISIGKRGDDERGYKWEHTQEDNGTMGMPKELVIPTWESLNTYSFPDPKSTKKYKDIENFNNENKGRYKIASMGISGFITNIFLRGFDNALIDLGLKGKGSIELLDEIFTVENEVIKSTLPYKFDGIMFYDDWGLQKNMIISPMGITDEADNALINAGLFSFSIQLCDRSTVR